VEVDLEDLKVLEVKREMEVTVPRWDIPLSEAEAQVIKAQMVEAEVQVVLQVMVQEAYAVQVLVVKGISQVHQLAQRQVAVAAVKELKVQMVLAQQEELAAQEQPIIIEQVLILHTPVVAVVVTIQVPLKEELAVQVVVEMEVALELLAVAAQPILEVEVELKEMALLLVDHSLADPVL
jgi:hypothetical protein